MSTELVKIDDERKELLKRTIAKGLTNDELELFFATASRLGLDPMARQIYAVKRRSKGDEGPQVMTIQTSIDGFRAIAERTGCYAPGKETVYGENEDGFIISATAYVKKFAAGAWHEIGETAHWSEYGQEKGLWKQFPRVMIAKCAEARALRRAFPLQLSGIYTSDEMPKHDVLDAEYAEEQEPTKELAPPRTDAIDAINAAANLDELEKVAAKIKSTLPEKSKERAAAGVRYRERKAVLTSKEAA